MNRFLSPLLLTFLLILYGCGYVISGSLRERADLSLALVEVERNPDAYKGKRVVWGGEIIRVLPQEDGRIFVEVRQLPLGWRGRPSGSDFGGKFLMILREGLDLSPFKGGTKITVAGEIEGAVHGKRIERIGEPNQEYVAVKSEEFHLWEGLFPPHSSPPPPASPWWYDPTTPGLRL